MDLAAVTNGDVIIISVAVAAILAAVTYVAGSAKAYEEIGKGIFAMDHDLPDASNRAPQGTKAEREAEIRQMLEAKAFRQRERGDTSIDVDAELERMLNAAPPPPAGADPALAEEVRQLVIARNHRRQAKGQEPLDVEAEIARRLAEFEDYGQ